MESFVLLLVSSFLSPPALESQAPRIQRGLQVVGCHALPSQPGQVQKLIENAVSRKRTHGPCMTDRELRDAADIPLAICDAQVAEMDPPPRALALLDDAELDLRDGAVALPPPAEAEAKESTDPPVVAPAIDEVAEPVPPDPVIAGPPAAAAEGGNDSTAGSSSGKSTSRKSSGKSSSSSGSSNSGSSSSD